MSLEKGREIEHNDVDVVEISVVSGHGHRFWTLYVVLQHFSLFPERIFCSFHVFLNGDQFSLVLEFKSKFVVLVS